MSKKKASQKPQAPDPLKRLKTLFRQQARRDLLWYHEAGRFVYLLHPQGGDRQYGFSRMQTIAGKLEQPNRSVISLATLLRYYRQFYNAYDRPEVKKLCIADDGFTLSWTHVHKLSSVEQPNRDRLQEQCIKNKWPTDKLQKVIEAKHGKQSQGGRPLSAPKSRVDNLQQLINTSEDWLRRSDEVWFGGENTLHKGEPKQRELAKLRKLVESADKVMAMMANKTKNGQRHLKALKAKVE